MGRRVCHEELIESTKAAGQARRQANQPQQLLLIATELADDRQEIVKIEAVLRDTSYGNYLRILTEYSHYRLLFFSPFLRTL